jgi:hypothetical protein
MNHPKTFLLALLLAAPGFAAQPAGEDARLRHELVRITQALLDAVGEDDKATWDRWLADDCLFVTEDGRIPGKEDLLAELQPLPAGYEGRLRVANPHLRVRGDAAVMTCDALETLTIHGQRIETRYHTTDTWVRGEDGWRLIASQVSVLPKDPEPVPVDPARFGAGVGRYALAPDAWYTVSREGDALFISRNDGEPA